MGFGILMGKGFHIGFSNGFTVSVQFGPGEYCDNYYADMSAVEENKSAMWSSRTAEVAVLSKANNGFVTKQFGYDTDILAEQSPEQVADLIARVCAQKAI